MLEADQQAQDAIQEQIGAERAAWRATRGTRWDAQRAAARKRDRARQTAWWGGLPPGEQVERRKEWSSRFAQLPLVEQERLLDRFDARSAADGVHPEQRRRDWLASIPPTELEERALLRVLEFAHAPTPLQAAKAASWARRRAQRGSPPVGAASFSNPVDADLLPVG